MRKKERRAFIRITVYHLAKYKSLIDKEGATPLLASLKDISAGGACLRTETFLPVSSPVELKINFPIFDNPISCMAKVVWVKRIGKLPRYEVGLQFMDLNEEARKAIDAGIKFVRQKLSHTKCKGLF